MLYAKLVFIVADPVDYPLQFVVFLNRNQAWSLRQGSRRQGDGLMLSIGKMKVCGCITGNWRRTDRFKYDQLLVAGTQGQWQFVPVNLQVCGEECLPKI